MASSCRPVHACTAKLWVPEVTVDADQNQRKEELELRERRLEQEEQRLKALHQQVETARLNAARRIRETEATVANERRCLMNDLEVFEEKRRIVVEEVRLVHVVRDSCRLSMPM